MYIYTVYCSVKAIPNLPVYSIYTCTVSVMNKFLSCACTLLSNMQDHFPEYLIATVARGCSNGVCDELLLRVNGLCLASLTMFMCATFFQLGAATLTEQR